MKKRFMSAVLSAYLAAFCMCTFVSCGTIDTPDLDSPLDDPIVAQEQLFYAYDAQTDEYNDDDRLAITDAAAVWHSTDVVFKDVDFTGTVTYSGKKITITLNGSYSILDTCIVTFRGEKESDGILRVDSTVITTYSEFLDKPTVVTNNKVTYYCKKGEKPVDPVLPDDPNGDDPVPQEQRFYAYDPRTEEYKQDNCLVITGTAVEWHFAGDGLIEDATFTGTRTFEGEKFTISLTGELKLIEFDITVDTCTMTYSGEKESDGVLRMDSSVITADSDFLDEPIVVESSGATYYCKIGEKPVDPVLPAQYTVILDANGGQFYSGASIAVNTESDGHAPIEQKPTRKGYIFKGYNTKADGSGDMITKETVFDSDATVYAVWAKEITVTFADEEGVTFKTVKMAAGDELGNYRPPLIQDDAVFIGWFDDKTYVDSTTPIYKDVTLTAHWRTASDHEKLQIEYLKDLADLSQPNHLYIHYCRLDHIAGEEGIVNPSAAPTYDGAINSAVYGDWALWAWPKYGGGRTFNAVQVDIFGAMFDIDLSYTFTDCGWDGVNKTHKNETSVFDTAVIGLQLFKLSSMKDSAFWVNDGGNIYVSNYLGKYDYNHIFLFEGHMSTPVYYNSFTEQFKE